MIRQNVDIKTLAAVGEMVRLAAISFGADAEKPVEFSVCGGLRGPAHAAGWDGTCNECLRSTPREELETFGGVCEQCASEEI